MMYTVGEAARRIGVAPSTLRYYEKEGLLPFVERSSGGIRMFQEKDFAGLQIIQCLKRSGLSIKDIRAYMEMATEETTHLEERLQLFLKQKALVEEKMAELQDMRDTLNYKCWFYETAIAAGTTAVPANMDVEDIPEPYRSAKKKMIRELESQKEPSRRPQN